MRFKKLLAGMTAAAILANFSTAAFAESGASVSAEYEQPMLSAAGDYIVSLDQYSSYEVNLAHILGDTRLADDFSIDFSVSNNTAETNVYLDYDIIKADYSPENKTANLGTITSDNSSISLSDKGIDFNGTNYRLRVETTDAGPAYISAITFNSGGTPIVYSPETFSSISWSGSALSSPVDFTDWEYFFYTNNAIRLSDYQVTAGEWIKITCSVTNANNGGTISVNGYDDGFEYSAIPDSGEIYVRVTQAMVDKGIEIRGQNATVSGIYFQSIKSEADIRNQQKVLFDGSAENSFVLSSPEEGEQSALELGRVDAQPGDIIRVEFAQQNIDGGWFWLHNRERQDIAANSLNVHGGLTTMEFTLDAEDAKLIRTDGLCIDGDNVAVNKVVLCSPDVRADIKDALAKVEYYDENARNEYWLNLARYGIDADDYTSATINITNVSETCELEAFYYTYDENGETKNTLSLTPGTNSVTVEAFPNNFCIAPNSGKVLIESVVLSDGVNDVVIDSDLFDSCVHYASLTPNITELDCYKTAYITAKDLKAAGAKAGDVLSISADYVQITPDQGDPYYSCCIAVYPFCSEEPSSDGIDGEIRWVLSQDMIDRGVVLRGECNITGVSLCADSEETRTPVTETIQDTFISEPVQFTATEREDENGNPYEECTTMTFGAGNIYHEGDVLRLELSLNNPEDSFLGVKTNDDAVLGNVLHDDWGNYDIWGGIPCIDIPLSAENVAKIEKMGFRIVGQGVTVNSAVLVSETAKDKTPLVAEITGREYKISNPLSFMGVTADQVAYAVADVYGNGGWGDFCHASVTNGWIDGAAGDDCYQVGIEEWRHDFTQYPLESGSKLVIQNYNDFPILLHEVRFYNSSDEVIFTLNADNANLNVVPFTSLNDGDEYWLNPGYFLGEELYAQFDKMVIETNGSNFVTAGYVASSSGEYTEPPAASTTLEISKSDLGEDWVKLVAANGAVDLISVTYYDADGEVLKVLDYTNVHENNIPATPFITLAKGEDYVISPFALLTDEQLAQPYNIIVETVGDPACGGALSWTQYFEDKLDDNGSPLAPDYYWTRTEDLIAGEEWRIENVQSFLDNVHPNITLSCWWDNSEEKTGVGIAAVRFEDAEGNELFRIDAEHQPKTICAVEPPVSDDDYSHNYPVNIAGILKKIGSELTAEDIGKVEVRTFGFGGLNIGRKEMDAEELKWINTGWINAGGVASVEVNLSNEDGSVTIQNWDHENVFELYSVSLYDKNDNLIVTLDASNAYLNSKFAPIFDDTTVYDPENSQNDKLASMPIYPKSILGENFSKLATVEIEAYGDGESSFRSLSGGSNVDRHINCTGWEAFDVDLEDDSSVLELFADNGRLIVMTIVFKDAEGNVLAELTGENFWDLNKFSGTSENLLAELTSDNKMFVINSKQLLGDDLANLSYITVKAKGYGNFGIGWNADYNKWVQTGFDLYADPDGSHTIARLAAEDIPGETHSGILLMCWDGYQSVESVTFYDAEDNVLFELNAKTAELNTETVDCTDYVKFNLYDYPLYEMTEDMDPNDYKGNIWFAPNITVSAGTQFLITVEVPAGDPATDTAVFRIMSGDTVLSIWDDYEIKESTYEVSMGGILSPDQAAAINETGIAIEGDNILVRSIILGSVGSPENITAIPGDGKATLTWDAVPGADRYAVYEYNSANSTAGIVGETNTPTFTVNGLTNGQEYTYVVKAYKKDLDGNINYNEKVTVTPSEFVVTGHSLLLGDDIGVNFYANIADRILDDSTAEIKFTVNGRETVVPVSSARETYNGYRFTCRVAAAEMNDVIKGQLYVGGKALGSEFTHSVKTYADYILANSNDYASAVPIVNAMLNYGAAAEKYFRGSTEMSFTKPDVSAEALAKYEYTVTDNDSVIDYVGQVISLKSKVTAKLYFSGKEFTLSDFTVTENGYEVETSRLSIGSDSNGTYLAITGIAANEMANVFEITVGGVTVGNYSVYSYVLDAIDSTTEGLSDVVAALYEYGKEAHGFDKQ